MHQNQNHHDIEWNGHYEQFGAKDSMTFQNMTLGADGKIRGGGKDAVGEFVIDGQLTGSDVHFTKAYKGAHTVKYTGKLSNGKISGTWDLSGMNGGFEIQMKTKQWKGWYEQNGVKTDMLASIDIHHIAGKRCPIRGLGGDSNGNYCLAGFQPIAGHNHTVMFTKTYFGQPWKVHYSGVIGKIGGEEKMRGVWTLNDEVGSFELVKQP